jgi:cation/acetate symporter
MKGITYTQIAQYVVLIFAYTIPAIFISIQLTGNPVPQLGLGSTLNDGSGMYLLDKLDLVLTDLGFGEYSVKQGETFNIICLTLSLMIGTAGLPHVITRFFTVPKVRDARSSAGWALVFIAILYTTAPAVGAMARLNLMDTIQTGEVGAPNSNLVYANRPTWFSNWEKTGLLKFEDKNGDGRIQYYGPSKDFAPKAAAMGWNGSEMTKVDNDIMVLANPEIANLPNWVIALVAAGGIAAALSTAAGLLLAISSSISHDLMKGVFTPNLSEKGELNASRIAMAGAILVAGYLGLHPPGFAAQVVALAFGLAAASLFPAILMGIFSKRVNRMGAIWGMLSGLLITLVYIFWFKGWFFLPGTEMAANKPENWFLGVQPESFGALGAVVNFTVAWVVSRLTAPPPEHIQHLVEDIRVPGALLK